MAFGVEARVPFLDYRLIEFVFRAPNAMRFGHGLNKRVLRKASKGLIPEQVRHRRDKLGYTTPEAAWLRGPCAGEIERILDSPAMAMHGYVRPEVAREQFKSFLAGAPIASAIVWRWVNLELWLRTFVDTPLRNGGPTELSETEIVIA
jgi:asparagine synthase (glutamine-hydrolysing)